MSGNTIIIWLSASVDYKVIGKNASGGIEWTIDNLTSSSAGNTNTAVAQADYIQWPFITINGSDTDHDIDFSAGRVADSTAASMLILESVMTKQIDSAWTLGNNAGGLFSGTVANSTTYYCFLIQNDTDETIDCGFDTSSTAANIPSGYTKYRRIAQLSTDGSANIDSTSIVPLLSAEIAKRGEANGTCELDESSLVPVARLPASVAYDFDISGLQSQITSNDSDITSLQSQVTSNDSDISSINSTLATKANTSGTYASLRAQATTASDVGLGSVNNYGASSSVTSNSTSTYATTALTNDIYNWLPYTAASSKGVGTVILAYHTDVNITITAGSNYSGSVLREFAISVATSDGSMTAKDPVALSGTWKALTAVSNGGSSNYQTCMFVRIS